MRRRWRWLVLLAAVALITSLPAVVGEVRDSLGMSARPVSAAELRQKILRSQDLPYSGYAEAVGGLALPVTGNQFTSVTDLLGGRSQLRVWWRARDDWRVDQISVVGETDVHADATGTWTWNYESNLAIFDLTPVEQQVRLPVAGDLLPPELGRRLLSQATPDELTRLPPRRIGGHTAIGVRLNPSDPQTTIDSVDVWAEQSTGIPVRVDIHASGSANPAMTTAFLDFNTAKPAASTTAFSPPGDARTEISERNGLTDVINRFGDAESPPTLNGVRRNSLLPGVGVIGVYGRGVTEFIAAPLPGRTARSLRDQLTNAPGVAKSSSGLSVSVGPLSLLLTGRAGQGRTWLLIGTVSDKALAAAAVELARYRSPG
jgi:hypothetical protein